MFHDNLDYFQKAPTLEVDLTQNQATMALRKLAIVDLLYFIMCENPRD